MRGPWGQWFRWSLVAVAAVFVLAAVLGSDPQWLNAVWVLALLSAAVTGVGWYRERRARSAQ